MTLTTVLSNASCCVVHYPTKYTIAIQILLQIARQILLQISLQILLRTNLRKGGKAGTAASATNNYVVVLRCFWPICLKVGLAPPPGSVAGLDCIQIISQSKQFNDLYIYIYTVYILQMLGTFTDFQLGYSDVS